MTETAMTEPWFITNASLPGRAGRWRIGIADAHIASVQPQDDAGARDLGPAWDAAGRLVSPGFVDPHLHLDKCLTSQRSPGTASNLDEAIRAVRAIKAGFTVADVAERGRRALRMGLQHGTVSARSNCEVDRSAGFNALEGLQQASREMAAQVDVQLIAFPQEGWFDTPGTIEDGAGSYVAQALERGVKVVGGNVNASLWPSDPQAQVDATFALAAQHDCDIDYHLDNADVAHAFTLPYVAEKVIAQGWQGRVAVSHIASLAQVSDAQAAQTIERVREADISVCVLPTRIRLTRVRELMEAGVNVACGTDNLRDPFVRFGDADPLKALLLLAQLTFGLDDASLEKLWSMATTRAARMLRLPDYGLAAGCAADLMVIDAHSVPQAILEQSTRLAVFKAGVQVAGPMQLQ
jgi:cytosine deaminase